MQTTITPATKCTGGGKKLVAHRGAGRPHAGDVSICWYCGHITRFDNHLLPQPITQTQLKELLKYDMLTYMNIMATSLYVKNKKQTVK